MNFNLRRVLMLTPAAGSAPTSALHHAPRQPRAGPALRLYGETWTRAGSQAAPQGPAPAPRLRPGPRAGRPAGVIIAPSGAAWSEEAPSAARLKGSRGRGLDEEAGPSARGRGQEVLWSARTWGKGGGDKSRAGP
jgi:hypothetical protein